MGKRNGPRDRPMLNPPFVLSLVGVIFAAGVAFADMRQAAVVERLRHDVARLEDDRRRLDAERERITLRVQQLEIERRRATNPEL